MTNELWSEVQDALFQSLGEHNYKTWIRPLEFSACEDGVAHFHVPTTFIGNWVNRNYSDAILRQLHSAGARVRRVEFGVRLKPQPCDIAAPDGATAIARTGHGDNPAGFGEAAAPYRVQGDRTGWANGAAGSAARGAQRPGIAAPSRSAPAADRRGATAATAPGEADDLPGGVLDPRFTFDSFVVGPPNELAHAAARRMAEGGPVNFNPLFLYGGVGLGKTHLMHAIAWQMRARDPGLRILYLSAEQFMYRFVQALREREMMSFKQLFRSVDVLMVDDVQFIAGKDSTQDEFFHTFNALIDQSKQIIISGDRAPGEMKDMEDRIQSRLQCGLVVDLHPTNYELRLSILQKKVEMYTEQHPGLVIAPGVLEFLAHRISTNVRVLQGALMRLFAMDSLVGREITMDMTQDCLADILRVSERKVTIEEIQRRVSEHYNIRLSDLIGPTRVRTVARPRQIAMYLAKTLTSRSLPDIGRRFGGRDHTTIMHGVKRIRELKARDNQVAEDVEMLRRALEA